MVRVPLGEVLMMTSFCTLIVLPTSDSSKSLKNRSYFSRLVCNNGGWLFFSYSSATHLSPCAWNSSSLSIFTIFLNLHFHSN